MDEIIHITELQRDAITELLNIGMGQAAASLSEMFNEEVELSVPSVELLSRPHVVTRLNGQSTRRIAAVKQHFEGALRGEALLLFPQDKSRELVKALLMKGEEASLNMLIELERDALTEVGNIILNSCLGSLANMLTQEFISDLPTFVSGTAKEVLDACVEQKEEVVLFLRMDFVLQTKDINGYVAFLLEVPSIEQVKDKVDYFRTMGYRNFSFI